MAESSITILELLVDAGPALTELETLLPPLERVAVAAQTTAEAVDRLIEPLSSLAATGSRVEAGATTAAAGVARLSAAANEQTDILVRSNAEALRAEQTLIRQSAASEGTVGVTLKLTKTLAELATAQTEVNNRMQQTGAGAIGGTQGTAELAALAERSKQVEAALAALRTGSVSVAEAMQRFPEAFSSSTNSAGQFINQLDRLVAKYDQSAATAARMAQEIALVGRAWQLGLVDGDRAAELQQKIINGYDTGAQAAQKAAEATQKLAEAQAAQESKQTAASAQKLREEFDAQSVAIERYEARLIELNKVEAQYPQLAGTVESAREKAAQTLSAQINALGTHAEATKTSAEAERTLANEHENVARGGNSARSSIQELEHVFRALFDSVGAGIPITQALRFEFPRIVEAVANLGYLGAGQNLVSIIFNPITIGLAAVAAGIYLVGSRAHEIESDLRSFGLQLSTVASVGGGQTSESLLKLVEDLRNTGSAASEAKAAVDKVLQAAPRGVNPGAAGTITFLARDIAAPAGGNALEETKRLSDAIGGGTEEFIKYGFAIGALTAPVAAYARSLADAGNVEEANQVILQRLQEVYGGAFQRSLSESARALIEVKAAWNDLRDALAKSDIGAFIVDQFKGIAEGIRTTVQEIDRIIGVFRDLRSAYHGLAPGEAYAPLPPAPAAVPGGGAATPLISGATPQETAILAEIRAREGGAGGYTAANPQSSATGAYQILSGTWADWTRRFGIGSEFPTAGSAPPAIQDQVALGALRTFGPNATQTWFESGAKLGNPYPTTGILAPTQAQSDAVDKLNRSREQQLSIDSKIGIEQDAERARVGAINEANAQNLQGEDRVNFIMGKVAEARDLANQRALSGITIAHQDAQLQLETAGAYQKSEVAGLQAAAMEKALQANRQSNVSVEVAYRQALETGAAAAVSSASQQLASTSPVLARQQQLADAALKGTAALNDARIAAQAAADTHHALAQAEASGNQQLIEEAGRLDAARQAQLRLNEAQQETIALGPVLVRGRDQLQLLQLETTTVGQTSEEQRRQLTILQAQQTFRERFPELAKRDTEQARETYNQYINQATAIADATAKLEYQRAAQERINEAVRQVADTIVNDLGTAMDNAFSGKKALDWGATMKSILQELLKQIAEFAFIKPLIGTALGALGFGALAQQYGSFAGVGGAGTAGGGLSLGTLSQGAGLANNVAGGGLFGSGGTGGLFSSFTSWLNNNIGTSLGFASTGTSGVNALSGAELAELGVPGASGGIFNGLTLTGALGGIGAGVGAGGLIASLTGGNPFLGSVGGGVGGLGGSLLTSALGIGLGPLGGIVGGLLGGVVGGLFGNNRPSGFSSGDLVNLTTGGVSGFQSSGNAQNDQTVQQISSSLSQFSQSIQQLTGGTTPGGSINVVASTRGIQTHYSGALGNIDATFQDAQSAITGLELAIAQNLSGVSDTLKTVLSHVTDPAQIQSAVQFATAYDNLKKAADSSFSSISSDVKTIGPFQSALENLNTTFQQLAQQAQQFGLSLDPINAGLAEATRRLQADFGTALEQALNTASSTEFLNQLTQVAQGFATNTREAITIGLGGDPTTVSKVAQLEQLQAGQILGGLSAPQLQDVISKLGQAHPEIAAMAQAILDAGVAANNAATSINGTATSLNSLASGIKSIEELLASLQSGKLSGLPPAKQVASDIAAFNAQASLIEGAGNAITPQELNDLTNLAQQAIAESQSAYGEGPQTAAFRDQAIGELTKILSITGPSTIAAAAPASATLAASNSLSAILAGSSVIQAAQAAQAASIGAGVTSEVQPNALTKAGATPLPAAATVAASSAAPAAAAVSPAGASNIQAVLQHFGSGNPSPSDIASLQKYANLYYGSDTNAALTDFGASGNIFGSPAASYAIGTSFTVPGTILVGENGPELISQPGGLSVTPISSHPSWAWRGGGTTASDLSLLGELQALRAEVVALRKQTQGGQIQASNDAAQQSGYLSNIDRKAGPGVVQPMRQRAGR